MIPIELFSYSCLQLGYPISLLMAKTAPPCLSRDLRGHALWHPEALKGQPRPALPPNFGLYGFLGFFGLIKLRLKHIFLLFYDVLHIFFCCFQHINAFKFYWCQHRHGAVEYNMY